MYRAGKPSQHSWINWPIWLNGWVFLYELSSSGFEYRSSNLNFRFCAWFEEGFPDIQATIDFGFWLKSIRDMIGTYSPMHHRDKYSQQSSIIWPIFLNGWVFLDRKSGCRFQSRSRHLNFRFCACFKQWVLEHSQNYRLLVHSELRVWNGKNI